MYSETDLLVPGNADVCNEIGITSFFLPHIISCLLPWWVLLQVGREKRML